MYILKNAVTSIKRSLGRNILIAIIFIVIACSCSVALAIKNSATKLIDSYKESYDITASISMDRNNFMGDFGGSVSMEDKIEEYKNIKQLTKEELVTYSESDYIKDFYYTYSIGMNSNNLEAISQEIEKSDDTDNNKRGPMGGMMHNDKMSMNATDFTVIAYSSMNAMTEFVSGNYKVTDGKISDVLKENECVINEELATANEISVGDTVTFYNPNDEKLKYELNVVAIYRDEEENSEYSMDMFSKSSNQIIVSVDLIDNVLKDDEDLSYQINPTYVLTDENVVDKFSEELTAKGLDENFKVTTNLDNIESEMGSITNVKTFATTLLIITLLIGGVVLFVLNMINVRERKYEIGVLRTIGMKKSLLSIQFILEIIIVAIISLTIGASIGASISVPVANNMLASEIESSKESVVQVENNFGGPNSDIKKMGKKFNGVVNVDKITNINAVVDVKVILQLLAVGSLLTLISGSASMISIQRFSPLTILKERS